MKRNCYYIFTQWVGALSVLWLAVCSWCAVRARVHVNARLYREYWINQYTTSKYVLLYAIDTYEPIRSKESHRNSRRIQFFFLFISFCVICIPNAITSARYIYVRVGARSTKSIYLLLIGFRIMDIVIWKWFENLNFLELKRSKGAIVCVVTTTTHTHTRTHSARLDFMWIYISILHLKRDARKQ